ncbi:MAG: hypothetical protein HN382_10115 [Gammaproteobacteria bacterium]|jgi:hypothetical protein|nr:hypothetical protein [Gammaproteobacteria bacterium]MBT4606201.1 hypothetical protein [Thiotrichales bacterium]MBT3472314.1 hypothetical protein [Gammaproteobacteria bacterium]MBT3967861.1 hypothetical protein [Gammaproteobacteria bacterium]MBT4081766.1 hypothetical protein [Gammaproteobacteria bacterium]
MASMAARKEQHRRSLLLVGVFTFLFHSVFPYYQIATAEPTAGMDGYTTTICTAYGYKTVFVAFDDSSPEPGADASSYYECPTCIVQANANGWIDSYTPLFEALLPQAEGKWVVQLSTTPERLNYPPFLIRGPPA